MIGSEPAASILLQVRVDGQDHAVEVDADRTLLDVLRRDLGVTGPKEGCSVGVCGACSILVDGRLLSSCIVLAVAVDGAEITTIAGLGGPDGELSPLQDAFIRRGGFQCGICTPGQIVAATALLAENPAPTEGDIRHWLAGNLCRCTGYRGIVEAVLDAAGGGSTGGPVEAIGRPADAAVQPVEGAA
jgi:carbon-monoxide dehydrogenase small subunit